MFIPGELTRVGTGNDEEEYETDLDEGPANDFDALHLLAPGTTQEEKWGRLEFRDKCRDVLNTLDRGERRWHANEPGQAPVLEDFKKTGLARGDDLDNMTPTALHVMARYYDSDFKSIKSEVLQAVVRFLLEVRQPQAADGEAGARPILMLAMVHDNDDFIECIQLCRPEVFADLLDVQGSDGKNSIHHIFAWPNRQPSRNITPRDMKAKTLRRAQSLVPLANPRTLTARDDQGNTPIHYALEYRQSYGRASKYTEMFRAMVLRADETASGQVLTNAFNNRNESPILYWHRTKKDIELARAEREKNEVGNSAQKQGFQVLVQGPAMKRVDAAANIDSKPRAGGKDLLVHLVRQHHIVGPGQRSNAEDRDVKHTSAESFRVPLPPGPKSLPERVPSPAWPLKPDLRAPDTGSQSRNERPSQELEKEKTPIPTKDPEGQAHRMIEFLERHYIATRLDLDARDLIHGKDVSDINLSLDASRHTEAEAIVELISRMNVSGFGKTLALVRLPTVARVERERSGGESSAPKSYAMNQGVSRGKDADKNPNPGSGALVSVFDTLYNSGVRHIIRLEVDDMSAPAHSDAAIERAIRGRDSCGELKARGSVQGREAHQLLEVDIWNWRKVDLSIDVIAFAAPLVEKLHLYWSGSQAVLYGWSSPNGIPKLYKSGQMLRKVEIHASPGLETRKRMDESLKLFKAEIEGSTNGAVDVNINRRMNGFRGSVSVDDDSRNGSTEQIEGDYQQHRWVEYMEGFRAALHPLHDILAGLGAKPQQVKVALIDDGVDLDRLDKFHGHLSASGVSYASIDHMSQSPWHCSRGGHGSIMANMILRMNPWVSLHVMKLRDGVSKDGGCTIFADSAARAIRGAIGRKVNIISMSWTIKHKIMEEIATAQTNVSGGAARNAAKDEAIAELEDALAEAAKEGILMFCSSSDEFQASAMDTLPYSKVPKDIFRIGAADKFGQYDAHVGDKNKIDFFFPGNQVAEAWNPRSARAIKYHDGSSVGTALAAGLASIIMYCAILVRTYHDKTTKSKDSRTYQTFKRYAEALQQHNNMKKALDSIYHSTDMEAEGWAKKKFLPVWKVFDTEKTCSKLKEGSDESKFTELGRLTTSLCSWAR